MSLPLPTMEEYLETTRRIGILDECCRILNCERNDFPRIFDGLIRSNEMLARLMADGTVSEDEVASLPKRWRKPFKRLRARP